MFAIGLRTEVPKRDNAMNAKNHPLNLLYEIFHISLLTKFLIAIHELTLVLTPSNYSQVTKNIPTSYVFRIPPKIHR